MPYSDKEWFALSRCTEYTGVEFDWYALDREGHLAVFTTAGSGPVPAAIWDRREEFHALEAAVDALTAAADFEEVYAGYGNYLEWHDLARKGLFAFDYQDVHRTRQLHHYDLMARPVNPVSAAQLLPQIDVRWLPVLMVEFGDCTQVPDAEIGRAEPGAAPNGSPAEGLGDAGDGGGPPSVS
jgi:hypothetical protein